MTDTTPQNDRFSAIVRHATGRFLLLGIVLVVAGVFAIAMPMVSTLAVAIAVAVALVMAGASQVVHAFMIRNWSGFLMHLLVGLIVLAGGLALVAFPLPGAVALTLMVAAIFVAKGIALIGLGIDLRPRDGWGWPVAAGVVSLLVGVMTFTSFPLSALTTPGIMAGLSLAFTGWSYIAIALAARRLNWPTGGA